MTLMFDLRRLRRSSLLAGQTDEKGLARALSLSQNPLVNARNAQMMKSFALLITAMFWFSGCEWLGPAEKYKTEPGRTTYRAADENPTDIVAPGQQSVPGEKKK